MVWPDGVLTTSEKKSVASLVVDETLRSILELPTIETGAVSGSVSRKPDWPGKKAALPPPNAPPAAESAFTAEPMPGSEEIAPGMPPIGATKAVNGVVIGIALEPDSPGN